ncbi:LpqB family beta-propeller domain-containing protein [Nocardioides KLBMP 9356]|uniref:LpqB family beta-propeller domain-containing protein n=1 Tax=Nocardioides potassii TaxID=2911371 RepID=A0ABS9HHQ3_9ACTN|nr:LpqB family beta-propeller domain-containing protein [Nocardioides potassii]MCF6379789.1 LpqB family beta-propeller domain-containing protein [Nocardioides potassii]
MTSRLGRALASVTGCALLAACTSMPTDGPVREPQVSTATDDAPGISFDPRPPQAGESPTDIVEGFLEAMKATPITTTVARQFLTSDAADAWAPEEQVITYAEPGPPSGEAFVQVPLTDINFYDDRGAWQRSSPGRTLELGLVQEDGEWRIDALPDALIVPESWFGDQYQRESLYYLDPTAEVLVAEPVYVPRGDRSASSLVRGLVTPLPAELTGVATTFFPAGTRDGLSVPIIGGIAVVDLSGDPAAVDEETGRRMLAQLAWTLRQDPRVRAIQLSVGDRAITVPEGSSEGGLDAGNPFDPDGQRPDPDLYALEDGRVVSGTIDALAGTLGPLGGDGYDVRSIGVSISGSHVAAVSTSGTDLLLAPTQAPDGEVSTPVQGATDLDTPHWDYRDRIWVLDRGAGRARVLVVTDGVAGEVTVPGVTGRSVKKILVSRDGSRLVAVVRGRAADRVVSTRILHDATGTVLGATPLQQLPLPAEASPRVRDVGWRSPTSIAVLRKINADFSLVRTVAVEGAPGDVETGGANLVRGPTRSLVSAPVEGSDVYALGPNLFANVVRPERPVPTLPEGLSALTYVG